MISKLWELFFFFFVYVIFFPKTCICSQNFIGRRGNQRCVSVYKSKKKHDPALKGKEDSTFLLFSDLSQEILSNLFAQYPPDDSELGEETKTDLSWKLSKMHRMKDSLFRKPLMSKDEITNKMEVFSGRVETEASLKQVIQYKEF